MFIKEIIVVEGRDDTAAIKRAVNADTIETGGSAISKETLERIKKAHHLRGVIIFTDPDYAGERIRKIISQYVPGVKHAFITRVEAEKNKDIGVENASPEAIRKALLGGKLEWIDDPKETIPWERLVDEGLIGGEKASLRRDILGQILGIGYTNGKQLYKRLKMFQITIEDFERAMKLVNEKE